MYSMILQSDSTNLREFHDLSKWFYKHLENTFIIYFFIKGMTKSNLKKIPVCPSQMLILQNTWQAGNCHLVVSQDWISAIQNN